MARLALHLAHARRVPHALAALTLALAAACGQGAATPPLVASATTESAPLEDAAMVDAGGVPVRGELAGWIDVEARAVAGADVAHGKALVATYECNRCHAGTGEPAPSFDRQCVHCHELVVTKKLHLPGATPARIDAWAEATHHYVTTPSLAALGETLRPSWIAAFVHEPVKVRPHEEEWMPRLRVSESDARDIAAYLTSKAEPLRETLRDGDPARGKEVVAKKGCFVCHELTGAERADVPMEMPVVPADVLATGIAQAPDLRLARERFRPDVMARWIKDPTSVRKDARMPSLGLTDQEARDAAAYILTTPLTPLPALPPPAPRLPLLQRHVSYEEVATRVFKRSCTHCHADPVPGPDPGPGSTGGFGFAPRGVALLSLAGARRGYLGADGARHSLFAKEPGLEALGGSRLVAALVARQGEVRGSPSSLVRGMPMGLPPLSPEDLQLVETWVAQAGASGAPSD